MVTTRRQTSASGRGRANSASGRGRANSRSTSRSASRSTSQRPSASRGRAARPSSTRGGRGRGASARRDDGDRANVNAELAELRRQVLEMREQIAAGNGTNLQLQREVDDLRAQENADGPANPDDMEEEPADREEPEVVVTDMPPPPPRAPRTSATASAAARQFMMKEEMRSWTAADNAQRWFITTTRPVAVSLTMPAMESMMHDTVKVTKAVLDMLNNLGGFDIREFIAPRDEKIVPDRLLTENFAIFIRAVIKLVSKGVTSTVGRARVAILQQGLHAGLHLLTQHCVECRPQMRVPENAEIMADYVNLDLNRWAARLYDTVTNFTAENFAPPSAEEFPPVVVPEWTRLSSYMSAGGLRHSQHQPPRSQSAPPGDGRGRSTGAGKKNYCHAWATAEGCPRSADECWYLHAHDPNPTGKKKRGGGNRGRRFNNRGGQTSGGGSSGGGSSGTRSGGGGGGASGGGGSNGGGSNGGNRDGGSART